jgi:hypothetical protein
MSTLLLERPPAIERALEKDGSRRLSDERSLSEQMDVHGGLTLDELITSVWEGMAVRDTVTCPVCHGPMTAGAYGGGSPTGGCLSCGSQLS